MGDSAGRQQYEDRVRSLVGFGHRGSATDEEAQAAAWLVEQLRASGIEAEQMVFPSWDALGTRILVHVAIAAVGLGMIWVAPWLTVALAVLVLVSFVGEADTRWTLLSHLLPRKPSHNVVGRIPAAGSGPATSRLVVSAHFDTQRTGLMWKESVVGRMAGFLLSAPGPLKSPLFPVMATFVGQLVAGTIAMIWPGAVIVTVLTAIGLGVYAIAGFLLAQWCFGAHVPGANDNATGVVTAIALAESWLGDPVEGVELVVLLTGSEETGLVGATAWAEEHRDELHQIPTRFLVVDTVGYDVIRFARAEHNMATLAVRYDPGMVRLCQAVAESSGLARPDPHELPTFTDAIPFVRRKIPGVTVLSFAESGHMPGYHQMADNVDNVNFDGAWRATEFCWGVLQRMADRTLGLDSHRGLPSMTATGQEMTRSGQKPEQESGP